MFSSLVILFVVLLLASIGDLRHRTIPNYLTYGGLFLAFVFAVHEDLTSDSIFETVAPIVSTPISLDGGSPSTHTASLKLPKPSKANWPLEPHPFLGPMATERQPALTFEQSTASAFAGGMAVAIPLLLLFTCGGIGGGDVKLGACIGALTGVKAGLSILFFGHLMAGAFALLWMLGNKQSSVSSRGIPMAVFYSLGTLFVVTGASL